MSKILRLVSCFLTAFALARAATPLPADFDHALRTFRADGAKYWGFTQSTVTHKASLVEHFDPAKPETERWTLLQKDGQPPSEKDLKEYNDRQTRRSSNQTAPDVTKQLDFGTAELVKEDPEHSTYRFHLKPGGDDDKTAEHMVATFEFHKPTQTIDRVELSSIEPFSPMFIVKIEEASTTIHYTLPTAERPSLLDRIAMHVRGRAMLFKSLDEDMTITYSDYQYAGKKPYHAPAPATAD